MSATCRYEVALVGEIAELRTRHAIGLPDGPQELMRLPQIIVLEAQQTGETMLFRYTADGTDCGDTWHQSIDDAKHQAAWEYEHALGMWAAAPPECTEIEAALQYARRLRKSVSRP